MHLPPANLQMCCLATTHPNGCSSNFLILKPVFDANAARQQFAQIKKNANDPRVQEIQKQFIDPTIQQAMFSKYAALVSEATYVPRWMAEKLNADNNSVAKASYVMVPYTTISDSAVKVSG